MTKFPGIDKKTAKQIILDLKGKLGGLESGKPLKGQQDLEIVAEQTSPYLKEALEIARAQASVRVMSEEEITSFIQKVAAGIRTVAEGEMPVELDSADMQQDARKSIKEKSVTCLECGKTFKILTKRHLAMHGMDAAAYREKWGFKKDTPLVCKALQRERRRKMKDMKLWEKRRKAQ